MAKILILLPLLLAGCANGGRLPTGTPQVEYSALGQEPGWTLRIDRERIHFAVDNGRTRIAVARPVMQVTAFGNQYATARLVVDIAPGGCRDVMNASGFADTVVVTTGDRRVRGCGGVRLVEKIS